MRALLITLILASPAMAQEPEALTLDDVYATYWQLGLMQETYQAKFLHGNAVKLGGAEVHVKYLAERFIGRQDCITKGASLMYTDNNYGFFCRARSRQ